MLRFDLENENETIRNYRERVRQCEALGEYAMAEQIRKILVQEQDHQIDLATALGEKVPDLSGWPKSNTTAKRGSHERAQHCLHPCVRASPPNPSCDPSRSRRRNS